MAETKYRGVAVPLNGKVYVIPSLTLIDFRLHAKLLMEPVVAQTPEEYTGKLDQYVAVIGMAVRRNYAKVTDKQLGEWLDLDTLALAMQAVQNAAGLVKTQEDGQKGNG